MRRHLWFGVARAPAPTPLCTLCSSSWLCSAAFSAQCSTSANGEGGGGRPQLEGGPRELPGSSTGDRPGSHPSLVSPGRGRPRTPPAHGVIHPEHAHKIEFLVDLFHPEFYTFKRMSRKIIRISESSYSLILLQTEQMKRIGNELDSVHFSLKKASQLVKEIGRQVRPPSPSMLV